VKALALIVVIMLLLVPVAAFAAETCPDGGEWTKIDSGDLSSYPVPGASELCFKAGNWPTVSSIPDGGFGQEGGGQDANCNTDIKYCDLSHWSYRIVQQDPTETPVPTDTPEPTPTYTGDPTATPTDPGDPTATPTNPPVTPPHNPPTTGGADAPIFGIVLMAAGFIVAAMALLRARREA
jgi:hypothetical protein